jgi:hypothetical protein
MSEEILTDKSVMFELHEYHNMLDEIREALAVLVLLDRTDQDTIHTIIDLDSSKNFKPICELINQTMKNVQDVWNCLNQDAIPIENPINKMYPTKQAIHACEIQLEVADNLLKEMKESAYPEKQDIREGEKETTA